MSNQQLTPRLNRHERNLLIDAGQEIWPDGTIISIPNNTDKYTSVLMKAGNANTGITMTSTQTTGPSGTNIPFSNTMSKSAGGSVAAGTYSNFTNFIEGYNVLDIYAQEFTLLFWVKSSVVTNRSISLRNAGQTHSYVKQYAIAQAGTWELKALRFDPLNTCPGTINRTNGVGANFNFTIVAGATYQTATLNQWVTGNYVCGVGEDTTWVTGTVHDFAIAGAIVLPGDWTAIADNPLLYNFVRAGRDFEDEVSKSERFYEKAANAADTPGAQSGMFTTFFNTAAYTTSTIYNPIVFKTRKRAIPTIVTYDGAGTAGRFGTLAPGGGATNNLIPGDYSIREGWFTIQAGATGSHAGVVIGWSADARF